LPEWLTGIAAGEVNTKEAGHLAKTGVDLDETELVMPASIVASFSWTN
jgi:hypothetical protein